MADVPGSSFDRALNLINRAVGMLRGGNTDSGIKRGHALRTRYKHEERFYIE